MIIEYIQKYGSISKQEIDKLILDILPNVLDEKQKANKIRNIIYAMSKRDESITNRGTSRYPKWILSSSKQASN
jgi:ATP-dependent DNA helicase RecG